MTILSITPKTKQELEEQISLLSEMLEEHIEIAQSFESVDKRGLGIAKTNLQTGFMWFLRALENDEKF